ncbi:MarR family transcriptional regulator [Priestia megaterium]
MNEKGAYNLYEYTRSTYPKCGFHDAKPNEKMQLSVIPTLKSYIPLNEFLALRLLYKEGNHIVSEIAEHMHISNSSMTCVSDRLMEREFVTRVRSQKTAALSTYPLRIKEKRLQKKWKSTHQRIW